MSIVQVYIAGDEEYEVANQILMHDLPGLDTCDADERETFVSECRWALGQKIKQVALLHAFREDSSAEDQSLENLCSSARNKILSASFMAVVQEFVLKDLRVADRMELHPDLTVIKRDTMKAYESIIRALGKNVRSDLPPTEEIQQPLTISPVNRKSLNKRHKFGDGDALSA